MIFKKKFLYQKKLKLNFIYIIKIACELSNCETCSSSGITCEQCEDNYILSDNNLCIKDTKCRLSNCKTCDSSLKTCKECEIEYILDSLGQCEKCEIDYCEECSFVTVNGYS